MANMDNHLDGGAGPGDGQNQLMMCHSVQSPTMAATQ